MAEFAARNVINDSTGMSPFFANAGYHPRMSFGPPRPVPHTVSKDLVERNNEGNDFAAKMQEITEYSAPIYSQSKLHRNNSPTQTDHRRQRTEWETWCYSAHVTSIQPDLFLNSIISSLALSESSVCSTLTLTSSNCHMS